MNLRQLICHHLYRCTFGYGASADWECVKCGHNKKGFKPIYWATMQYDYIKETKELMSADYKKIFDKEYKNQITTYSGLALSLFIIIGFIYFLTKHI